MKDKIPIFSPRKISSAAIALGLTLFQGGCVFLVVFSDGCPTPMLRSEFDGAWVAPGYQAGVWRLVLHPDGTGTLSYALLQDVSGVPRQTVGAVTSLKFDESKGSAVITVEDFQRPGCTEILRLSGARGDAQLCGTATEQLGSPLKIEFVRESQFLDALKRTSAADGEMPG